MEAALARANARNVSLVYRLLLSRGVARKRRFTGESALHHPGFRRDPVTAWRLGEDASARDVRALVGEDKTALSFVGKLIEWIPADVVALYAALITALETDPAEADAKYLIGAGVILALVAVPLGAWSGRKKLNNPAEWWTKLVKKRTLLAPIAFLIWSPTVPDSGWQDIKWISDNPGVTTAICAVLAFLFALVANGIDEE